MTDDEMKRLRKHYNPAAEIAALRERVERAADALERWMCDSSYDSSKGVNVVTAALRILRGEGE